VTVPGWGDARRWWPLLAQCLCVTGLFVAAPGRAVWLTGLLAVAGLGIRAWLGELRHMRALLDTPVTRIASAAQGYVALRGVGRPLPGQPVLSPARHLPCLWYRYRRYQRHDDKWLPAGSGESDADFILDDGSACCLLRPGEAQVHSDRIDTYTDDGIRHVEEILLAGETLHALGHFQSLGGEHADGRLALDGVLSEWKADQASLVRRFDRDGNGRIDAGEWHTALDAARNEVLRRQTEDAGALPGHVLLDARDGRPCVIANHDPARLARKARLTAWLYACSVLAALALLAYAPP
jgi:hypothetical protein